MPTGAVLMPQRLGHGISGIYSINASNETSTSMFNISPLFCYTVRSLQLLHLFLWFLFVFDSGKITPCSGKHVN